jgi:hypothetical protein
MWLQTLLEGQFLATEDKEPWDDNERQNEEEKNLK